MGAFSPADAKVSASAINPRDGVPFEEVFRLPLSSSAKTALEEARLWAERERLRGWLGTGMMLLALVRRGEAASPAEPDYAPRFLFEQFQRHAGARFANATQIFLERSRHKPGTAAEPPSRVSPNLWLVLTEAGRLPNHDGILAARHLIVALLLPPPRDLRLPFTITAILEGASVDRELLLAEFLQSLVENAPPTEREGWAKLAAEHPLPAPRSAAAADPPAGRGPLISCFDADTPSGRAQADCLGLDVSVNALANLIASTQLDNTLSLGVFGNWGSGKSSFMKRLREEIEAIAEVAREQPRDGDVAYWPNIAQVEFNAWHYVDANLWASLMSHLLEELRRWDPDGRPVTQKSPIAEAIEQLEITATARQAAEERKKAAEEGQRKAAEAANAAKEKYASAAKDLGGLLARSVWSFVEPKLGGERAEAEQALRELGLLSEGAVTSTEALFAQVRDVASTAGRLHTIAHQLLRDSSGSRRLIGWTIVVFAAIAAIVVASYWFDWLRNAAAVVSAAIAGFATVAGRALAWVQKTAGVVHEKLAPLRSARAAIEQKLAEAEAEKATCIANAEKEVALCRAEVDAATAAVAAREQDVRAATQAVADAISGRAVRQFIEQRLATGDYQKHLGLIATIRRDFEQLSDLICAHNANRRRLDEDLEHIKAKLLRARPELQEPELEQMFANIGLNRIVLYVDDLDRCPSARVVEVLQAIHLLVSFPIFVVVVGVDSRWMAHSLAREYPNLLTRVPETDAATARWSRDDTHAPVTPADYLEKIFQIPFWVPPLTTANAQKLIGNLTEPLAGAIPFGAAANESPAGGGLSELGSGAGLGGLRLRGAAPIGTGESVGVGAEAEAKAEDQEPAAQRNREKEGERRRPAMRPDLLRLAADERTAMHSLAALIGRSPRATKRFVNSYRLLKVALVAQEPESFARDSEAVGHLAGPMFLLAVVTGLPTLAAEFVRMLPDNPGVTAVDLLLALAKWAKADPQHTDAVRRIREFAESDTTRWRDLADSDLRQWAHRVAQFSFEDLVPAGSTGERPF